MLLCPRPGLGWHHAPMAFPIQPASCAEQGSQLCLGAWVRSQGWEGAAAPVAVHLEHSWAARIVE